MWRRARVPWSQAKPDDREERILDALALQDAENWTVTQNGIFFVRRTEGSSPRLAFFNLQDGTTVDVAPLNPRFNGQGLAVSPDGAELLYARQDRPESDLQLARPTSAQ